VSNVTRQATKKAGGLKNQSRKNANCDTPANPDPHAHKLGPKSWSEILIVVVGFGAMMTISAHAESKYNPYTRQWEDVSPDAVPTLNPVTGHWELATPGSQPKLNPYTRQYEMVPPNSITRFNPYTKQWELAPPNAKLELDPHTNAWHYTR
jgi:hypothetical protein